MNAERWAQIRASFDELIELEPSQRAVRLASLAGSDPDLHLAVELLLAADVESSERLQPFDTALPSANPDVARDAPTQARKPDPLSLAGQHVAHFEVEAPIGAGGMGVVYRARDTRLGRTVALKFLLPAYVVDTDARARFLREAQSAASLEHSNICAIHEVGTSEDGRLFLAMPLYRGETLRARLRRTGSLSVDEAIAVARQTACGLQAAHAAGIVHRDLTPGNVMLLPDGTIKILDFGLARVGQQSASRSGAVFGTVSYMAPQQIRGEAVDERADLWALGVLLYESLTGGKPFNGAHDIAVAHAILHDQPSTASIPGGERLAALIVRCLEKSPDRRLQSAEEFLRMLDGAGDPRPRPELAWVTAKRVVIGGAVAVLSLAGIFGAPRLASLFRPTAADSHIARPNQSVAVLYFRDASSARSLGYLADGLTEALIDSLRRLPGLRVTSSDGARRYRASAASADSIARLLHVSVAIRGDIDLAGDSLRVTLWRVDTSGIESPPVSVHELASDPLTLQRKLPRAVTELLQRSDARAAAWIMVQKAERNRADADSAWARRDTAAALRQVRSADSLLQRAQKVDTTWVQPSIVRGWMARQRARMVSESAAVILQQGIKLATAVVEREPTASAFELRGTVKYNQVQFRSIEPKAVPALLVSAEQDLLSAVRMDSTRASAWNTLSLLYYEIPDLQKATWAAKHAEDADPNYRSNASVLQRLFYAAYNLEQFDDAMGWCNQVRQRYGGRSAIECRLMMYRTAFGRPDADSAWIYLDQYVRLSPASDRPFVRRKGEILVAAVLARAAQHDSARRVLLRARAAGPMDPHRELAANEAAVRVMLGDHDEAIRLIRDYLTANPDHARGFRNQVGWYWRDLRALPRFQQMLATFP